NMIPRLWYVGVTVGEDDGAVAVALGLALDAVVGTGDDPQPGGRDYLVALQAAPGGVGIGDPLQLLDAQRVLDMGELGFDLQPIDRGVRHGVTLTPCRTRSCSRSDRSARRRRSRRAPPGRHIRRCARPGR